MNFFWPWVGMIPALITYGAMYFNGFFVSFYINRETSNFNDLLSNAPTSLDYTVSGSTQQGTGDESHFALDTSRLVG